MEAAGLTMEHLVYTHVYLRDMANYDALNQIYRGYFSKPPARAVLGIAGLRDGALIDMKAVAVRHLYQKQLIQIPGFQPKDPYTPGILTHDQLYVSAMLGIEPDTGRVAGWMPSITKTYSDRVSGSLAVWSLDKKSGIWISCFW